MRQCILICLFIACSGRAMSQAQELEQLALDIEKLSQFKKILSDLKAAYDILYGGYTTIKNISQGNFSLHETFLNGLLAVSPSVRQYKRIGDIITIQLQLVKESKSAKSGFAASNGFSAQELSYISGVYARLLDGSLKDLDALVDIITANKLRMSDEERLNGIDRLFKTMEDKLVFLRHFNGNTSILAVERSREQADISSMKKIYNLK